MENEIFVGSEIINKEGQKAKILSVSRITKHYTKIYVVKFLETGFTNEFDASALAKGSFKDYCKPSVYGVGYSFKGANKEYRYEYKTWIRMLERCYSKKNKAYKRYGGRGVKVCDRWHSFANFLEDVVKLENYDKYIKGNKVGERNNYSLDKDRKSGILYSPETCMFLNDQDQTLEQKRISKVKSIDEDGNERTFRSICEACRELGVQSANLYKVLNRERKSTMGYRFERLNKIE